MATLIKRPGSKYFIAAFDILQPDGTTRRLKKSTKCVKRSEAMTEAIRLEELERKADAATGEHASEAYAILSEAATAAAKGELSEAARPPAARPGTLPACLNYSTACHGRVEKGKEGQDEPLDCFARRRRDEGIDCQVSPP
jgi:hypothetical protein